MTLIFGIEGPGSAPCQDPLRPTATIWPIPVPSMLISLGEKELLAG
jgi:hypothetical protein